MTSQSLIRFRKANLVLFRIQKIKVMILMINLKHKIRTIENLTQIILIFFLSKLHSINSQIIG